MTTIKHLIITLIFLSLTTGLFAQVKLGGGFSFGSGPDELALQIRAGYQILPVVTGMIDYNYYLDGEEGYRARTLNFNGQYHFFRRDEGSAYGLAGLNLTKVTYIYGRDLTIEESTSGAAFNLGAGGQYRFAEKLSAFAEFKYIIGDFDQFVAGLGVVYHLDVWQ